MPTLDAHAVLVRAKEVLLTRGWRQYTVGRRSGPVCLMGALNVASWGYPDFTNGRDGHGLPMRDVAWSIVRGILGREIAEWNDESDRTFADVISLIDKAIIATAPSAPQEAETREKALA